jgi:hypothetical protein
LEPEILEELEAKWRLSGRRRNVGYFSRNASN